MRKTLATAVAVALGLTGLLSAPGASATESQPGGVPAAADHAADGATDHAAEVVAGTPAPAEALAVARRVLQGDARAGDPSATVALRDLWLRADELDGAERRTAFALLARPTDGTADRHGFGYDNPATAQKLCSPRVCVWYVPSGGDAPDNLAWVQRTLDVVESSWTRINGMGYRSPVSDGGLGGTPQFDVYLKDLGADSLYGYCAGERRAARRTASGYCVVDNDFAEFPGTPDGNLRVTAAHEFFHAVQYAYDYAEDPWMMESTATWIEERLATDVNDNRYYLPYSQLYRPLLPLDIFQQGSGTQYGNWIFWEYLSSRYGAGIVLKAWKTAGTLDSDGKAYSFEALRRILRKKGTFPRIYAKFASDNLVPSRAYPEGAAYPAPRPKRTRTLTKGSRSAAFGARLNHMTSASYRLVPAPGLKGRRSKLRLVVNGPVRKTSPYARVIVHLKNGRLVRKNVKLNRSGDGQAFVTFNSRKVAAVSVTLVNASTRMRCNQRTPLACAGLPIDDSLRFKLNVRAVKR